MENLNWHIMIKILNKLENLVENMKYQNKVYTNINSKEEVKSNTSNHEFHQKEEQETSTLSENKYNSIEYKDILPQRLSSVLDVLGMSDVIEIAFRSEKYNKLQLQNLIKSWYPYVVIDKSKIEIEEIKMLKVFVWFDDFEAFVDVLDFII